MSTEVRSTGPGRDVGIDIHSSHAVVVDLGTGGPKVGLCTLAGQPVWQEFHEVETTYSDGGAGAVQDAEEWWRLVADCTRRALASGVVDPSSVKAVSITGQWASTVPVDEAGVPVAPAIMWMDTRATPLSRATFGGPVSGYNARVIAEWVRRSGGAPALDGADVLGNLLWLRDREPDVWRRARWFMEPVDYLSMRFSGVAAASPASMCGAFLCDTRDPSPTGYDPWLVGRAGVDASKLPPLQRFGTVIGPVAPQVASDLGLPADCVVVTGSPDLHSAVIGAGAVRDYEAHMAVSTTAWISCPTAKKKTDPFRQIATVPGVTPDRYVIANNHETAGLCLRWFRGIVADHDTSFDELTEAAATAAPGSGGVIFTPWLNGERSPVADRLARGGFHNLGLATTRADMTRAVLEGVALNNRWLLDAVEKFVGRELNDIRFIGGGAISDLWCQVHADVMNRRIEQVPDALFCGLRGAALVATRALGAIRDDEIRALVGVKATYRPDAGSRATYERLYAEFPGLYKSQRKMFHRLNRGSR